MPGLSLTLRLTRPGPLDVSHAFKAFLIRSPLPVRLRRRPVPLLHFTPSGYCPSQQVGHSYLCLPLLPFPAGIAARAAASEVYSLLEVFPILRSRIDPHGCSALQGFHLSRSCFAASSKLPASRFDGSQVLSPRLSWLAMGQSRSAWLAPDVRGSRCRPS